MNFFSKYVPGPKTRPFPVLGVATGIFVSGLVGLALFGAVIEPDFFSYLNYGRFVRENHFLPYSDPFSYLATRAPWVFHEWLTGIVFSLVYERIGAWPLQAGRYLAGLLSAWLLFSIARRRGAPFWAAALSLGLVFPFFMDGFPPVLARGFTSLGLCSTMYACERLRTGTSLARLWWLPMGFVLWANLHGGFPAGLGVIFIYAAGGLIARQRSYDLIALLAACTLATLINPYGIRLWEAVLSHASGPDPEIPEWLSFFRAAAVLGWDLRNLIFAALILLFVVAPPRFTRNDLPAILTLAAFACMGLAAVRHMALFAFTFAAYMPSAFSAFRNQIPPKKPAAIFRTILIACLLAANIGVDGTFALQKIRTLPGQGGLLSLNAPECGKPAAGPYCYPEGAVRFIRENRLCGKLLTETIWGGYFTHELFPCVKIAVDTRLETVFPLSVRKSFFDFWFLRPGWEGFLARHSPDIIVIPLNRKLFAALSGLPGFRLVYLDRSACVFIASGKS